MTYIGQSLSNAALDAAGRQRGSELTTYGEYKVLNTNFPSLILEQNGTGTFTVGQNKVNMSVGVGQYAIITSKQYHPYFNGRSQIIEITSANMGAAANVEKSLAYISSNSVAPFNSTLDGFRIFKSTSDVYAFEIWRNGTRTQNIIQSTWNDKLDGTGPSGMTINWNNFNVFMIDFLYLGGTAVRLWVFYNGDWRLVNIYYYANTDNIPIFNSPNKQIRYEIRSTTGTGNMDFICAMVGSEGGKSDGSSIVIPGANTGITGMLTATTYAICGVRKAATQRDIFAQVKSFEGIINTNDYINLELRLNPTVAGAFTYSAVPNTPLEQATGALTNTVTGGTILANTWFSLNMNNAKEVDSILARLNSTLTNTMDTLVLCATPVLGSTGVRATGSLNVEWFNQ